MARMTLVAFQVEGDASAISAAMETVRSELQKLVGPVSLPVDDARVSAPAPQLILKQEPSEGRKKRGGAQRATRQAGTPALLNANEKKEPRTASFEAKALEMIRNSHQGVTSEDICKVVGCATIQSAYQLCLALQKKDLVQRLDSGAWKALNG